MSTATTLDVAADHPAYAGHFPGAPVLPGVVLLDTVLRQIARSGGESVIQWQIVAAKFHSPVTSGEALHLEHECLPDGSLRFSVSTGDVTRRGRTIATGLLRLQTQASA